MGNHASQYPEGVLESTGESLSRAEEEIFESSSTSSIIDEQTISQLSNEDRHVSKTSLNSEFVSVHEYHRSTKPLPMPATSDSTKFTLVNNPDDSSLDKCTASDVYFATTEKLSLFGSSFGSSSSSIVNVSHESDSCSEENEESNFSSEASFLQCIEKMHAILSNLQTDRTKVHDLSSSSLKCLKDLYQTIGGFLSYAHQLSSCENVFSKQEKENVSIQSVTQTYNIINQSECGDKSADFTGNGNHNNSPCRDMSKSENIPVSKMSFLEESDENSSTTMIHDFKKPMKDRNTMNTDQSEDTVESDAVNLPESTERNDEVASQVDGSARNQAEAEAACMFIAERLSVEPLLMKSLAALQASTGAGTLLTDADASSSRISKPSDTSTKSKTAPSPKEKPQSSTFSSRSSKSLRRTTAVTSDDHTKTEARSVVEHAKYSDFLRDVLIHDKSAAAVGKAVIKNALAFQKYAELFKVALNEDLVAAAIGKALCINALSLEDLLDVGLPQVQKNQSVNTSDKRKQSHIIKPKPKTQDEKDKENESPAIEHLFKQTPCKRKLALEEETRRFKCLALSPKQTSDKLSYEVMKSAKKLKHLSFNDSKSGLDMRAKIMKKNALKEIVTNAQFVKNYDNDSKYLSHKANKPEQNPRTLDSHTNVFDPWAVVTADDKDLLVFDESDDEESAFFFERSNIGGNLCREGAQERENRPGIGSNNTKQLDPWAGVYYFVNKYIFCSVCNVNIFNYLRVLDHINSESHKINIIQQHNVDATFISVGAMLQSVWDRIELNLGKTLLSKLIQLEDDAFFCSLCNIQVCGHLNVIAHIHSKSHQLNAIQKVCSSTTGRTSQQGSSCTDISQSKISWPDSTSSSSSSSSVSEEEGSIAEWLMPTLSSFTEGDLSGIYYFAKNYVFCSVCNINMFNSSIVLGHAHAKSHQANKTLQKQIESSKKQAHSEGNKLAEIWSQIERTLGGTLFHTVLCIDNNAAFFCDLCNIQIVNPNHMGVLNHVCSNEHKKKFFGYIQHPSSK